MVSLADGYLVYGQNAKTPVIGFSIFFFQKEFVDLLDGLPVQSQVIGHILHRQHLAEFVYIEGKPFADPLIRSEEFQVFDHDSLTLRTENLAILTIQPYPCRSEIQVSNDSLLLAVNLRGWTAAEMADGMESFVGNDFDPSLCGFGRNALTGNSNSTEWKIMCYTEYGHRRPPWYGFLEKNQFYLLEIPDVHFPLKSKTYVIIPQLIGR